MPDLDDAAWLRERIEAGASATEIGDETGHTPRKVRDALRAHGIPLPRQQRLAHVDWAGLEHDWRKGYPVKTIARLYRLTEDQVTYQMADVPRVPLPTERPSKYPQLNDPSQLRIDLALGRTVGDIARDAGCARRVVVAALRRHGITVPPRRMPRLERVRALVEPAERAQAAALLELAAEAEADEARRIMADARREARAALTVAARRGWGPDGPPTPGAGVGPQPRRKQAERSGTAASRQRRLSPTTRHQQRSVATVVVATGVAGVAVVLRHRLAVVATA